MNECGSELVILMLGRWRGVDSKLMVLLPGSIHVHKGELAFDRGAGIRR